MSSGSLTLDDARRRRGELPQEKMTPKAFIRKHKGTLMMVGGVAVLVGGYFAYRSIFKKKTEVENTMNVASNMNSSADDLGFM